MLLRCCYRRFTDGDVHQCIWTLDLSPRDPSRLWTASCLPLWHWASELLSRGGSRVARGSSIILLQRDVRPLAETAPHACDMRAIGLLIWTAVAHFEQRLCNYVLNVLTTTHSTLIRGGQFSNHCLCPFTPQIAVYMSWNLRSKVSRVVGPPADDSLPLKYMTHSLDRSIGNFRRQKMKQILRIYTIKYCIVNYVQSCFI